MTTTSAMDTTKEWMVGDPSEGWDCGAEANGHFQEAVEDDCFLSRWLLRCYDMFIFGQCRCV